MKKAMSMIELVISIVIMGIVVSGIPMILQKSQNSSTLSAIREQNTLAAKTQLWRILSYDWAPNSYNQTDQKSYIIDTAGNAAFNTRAGLTGISGRRVKSPISINAGTIIAQTLANITSIDGFHNLAIKQQTAGRIGGGLKDAGKLDFIIKTSTATAKIEYLDDRFIGVNFNNQAITLTLDPNSTAPTTSNIKLITLTVDTQVDVDGDTKNEIINMYGFAANIGESANIAPRGL